MNADSCRLKQLLISQQMWLRAVYLNTKPDFLFLSSTVWSSIFMLRHDADCRSIPHSDMQRWKVRRIRNAEFILFDVYLVGLLVLLDKCHSTRKHMALVREREVIKHFDVTTECTGK